MKRLGCKSVMGRVGRGVDKDSGWKGGTRKGREEGGGRGWEGQCGDRVGSRA